MLVALIGASVAVAIKHTDVWCIIMRFMFNTSVSDNLCEVTTVSHVVLVYMYSVSQKSSP